MAAAREKHQLVRHRLRLVVGISGSSGPQYGIALLRTLHSLGSVETHLVLSDPVPES